MVGQMAPVIVLLHGFTHTGASWDPVVAALGESYRALAPDIRGHGSAAELEPSLEEVLSDLGSLTTESFELVGYSMGGRIALHAALAFAERVKRLVLVSSSPGIRDADERDARRAADERLALEIEGSRIEEFVGRWEGKALFADQPRRVAEAARTDRLRNRPAGLAHALRGLGTGALAPVWDRLGELAMPVTVVVGERDPKFVAIGKEMVALIPSAKLEIVAGAGHAVHLERPELLAELIR